MFAKAANTDVLAGAEACVVHHAVVVPDCDPSTRGEPQNVRAVRDAVAVGGAVGVG
jgi:hypothetical protein